ncbi:MAG: hemerythrin family protein [Oligoflexia bacterium]|nr:hemerythrin family protein [Oligoflexia bacterium]
MFDTNKMIDEFKDVGFYLFFTNGEQFFFNKESVEKFSKDYIDEKLLIENRHKIARCGFCLSQSQLLCDAIRPFLTILPVVDKYPSYEPVTVVWKKDDTKSLVIISCDLQKALDQIVLWSLISFCKQSNKYKNYYTDIEPFTEHDQIARLVMKNIYITKAGDVEKIKKEVRRFYNLIFTTTKNKISRMATITHKDAFANALVRSISPLMLLEEDADRLIAEIGKGIHNFNINTSLDSYKDRIATINIEHENIKNLMTEIRHKLKSVNSDVGQILDTCKIFSDMVAQHMKDEEDFFKSCQYVYFEYHMNAHQYYLIQLDNFLKEIRALNLNKEQIDDFLQYSERFFAEHISELDRDYILYLD